MKLIPDFDQQLDSIVQLSADKQAKCICFFSPNGNAGVSSLTLSFAKRLQKTGARVLVLDFNNTNPMSGELNTATAPDETTPDEAWQFDTISTQLSINQRMGIDFLSISTLSSRDSARDVSAVHEAFIRWQQEFDCILVDSSPLLEESQYNIPSRVFANAAQLSILLVSAGETTEEALVTANQKIEEEGFKNVHLVLSQVRLPPLGPRLLEKVASLGLLPQRIKTLLQAVIRRQAWLFRPIGV